MEFCFAFEGLKVSIQSSSPNVGAKLLNFKTMQVKACFIRVLRIMVMIKARIKLGLNLGFSRFLDCFSY